MGLSSHSGHARTSITNPDSFAVCDICAQWWNHSKLSWQYQWAGNTTVNLRLLACPTCVDVPNEQLRSLVLPPDPIPTKDPRLEPFQQDANAGNLSGFGYQNGLSGQNGPVTNWDQAGATWDTPGNKWDTVNQDVPTPPSSSDITNWDQPGADWDTPGAKWDNEVPD